MGLTGFDGRNSHTQTTPEMYAPSVITDVQDIYANVFSKARAYVASALRMPAFVPSFA
jgi:hypothetical protein